MNTRTKSQNQSAPQSEQVPEHTYGPENAALTILEYGDYQCPYCAEAHETIRYLQENLADQLRFIYRHFPLTEIHDFAQRAAEAAEAAGAQGEFWAMHDMLFENQDALDNDALAEYAEVVGLDVARFKNDLKSGTYLPVVQEQMEAGKRDGVDGTPTFFVNGARYGGPSDPEGMLAYLRELLK